MSDLGMERDAITYSALISALSKGRQWGLAIDVFNHMVAEGVECDAVTCCSLITALDKGGQWQLAEQVCSRCVAPDGPDSDSSFAASD
jgi:pentatricopeptide repeat domain-containing protein 1